MADGFPDRVDEPALHLDQGGDGQTLFVLLHGLNATGAVWRDVGALIEEAKMGRWVAPDLPGQGASDWCSNYALEDQARAVAKHLPKAENIIVAGHSKGANVGMTLAGSDHAPRVSAVLTLSVKTDFTDEEVERIVEYSVKPPRWFETQEEAAQRYLKVSGLDGLAGAEDTRAARGIVEGHGGWRLATDPRCTIPGGRAAPLFNRLRCPVIVATGEEDPIGAPHLVKSLDPEAIVLPGADHNVHVTHPEEIVRLLRKLAG